LILRKRALHAQADWRKQTRDWGALPNDRRAALAGVEMGRQQWFNCCTATKNFTVNQGSLS
jgi:hypothetical protein